MTSDPINARLETEILEGLIAAAGKDGLSEILDAFWSSTDGLIASLQSQIEMQDWAGAAASAHAIKGSAGNIGAAGLADVMHDIDLMIQSGACEQLAQKIESAKSHYADTRSALHAFLNAA